MPDTKTQTPIAWATNTHALVRLGSGETSTPEIMTIGSASAQNVEAFEPTVELTTISTAAPALALAHNRQRLRLTHATPAMTIPLQASVAFPTGFFCFGTIQNGGTISIAAPGTLNGASGGSVEIGAEVTGADFTLVRTTSNEWLCITGAGSFTGAQIIAAIGDESAEARLAHLSTLVEDIADDDGFMAIEDGEVVRLDYFEPTGTSDRVWMDDAAGDFKKATYAEARTALGLVGRNTIWIPAGSIEPRTTSGAESTALETATNKVMRRVLAFDTSADEFGQFDQWLPKSYNASTLTAQFVWSHPSTTTNFDVTWAIQGRCLANDDASDQAFGTAQTVTDAGGTTDDVYFSPVTSAITLAGTPAKERLARFQVYRDVDGNGTAGNDDLAVDARLIGVVLYLTTNAATDD